MGCQPPAAIATSRYRPQTLRGVGWQPPDAIAPPSYALGVDGVGAVRPGACDGPSNESSVRIGRRRVEQRLI